MSDKTYSRIPQLLTLADVAKLLRVTTRTVYRLVKLREIPGMVQVGRRWRFNEQAIADWLAKKSQGSE